MKYVYEKRESAAAEKVALQDPVQVSAMQLKCMCHSVCGVSGIPTGATLKWKDLSYSISVGTGASLTEKNILKNITGFAEPGRLIAIMGPTGSGKTTLLNFLAARTLYCKGMYMRSTHTHAYTHTHAHTHTVCVYLCMFVKIDIVLFAGGTYTSIICI